MFLLYYHVFSFILLVSCMSIHPSIHPSFFSIIIAEKHQSASIIMYPSSGSIRLAIICVSMNTLFQKEMCQNME